MEIEEIGKDKERVRERKEEAMGLRESKRFRIAAYNVKDISISIKLQW